MEGRTLIRVRYGETDCMGRVHHSNYISYFECGRIELMRECGFDYSKMEREDACFLPVFEVRVKYMAPAFFDEELEIVSRIVDYSFFRLTFQY